MTTNNEIRRLDLMDTGDSTNDFHDTFLTIGIKGQKALTVSQLFTIGRVYKHWGKLGMRILVWLIKRYEL